MVVRWEGFSGSIQEGGAIAKMVLQEGLWEKHPSMTWRALFHPDHPTTVYRNVNTFEHLEDAYKWCVKQINEHERTSGRGSSSESEIPQGGS